MVELLTLGTSQVGQDPELAMKLVTDPPPVLEPVKVQVVPEQDPAPEEKENVKAPATVLMDVTPAIDPHPVAKVQISDPFAVNLAGVVVEIAIVSALKFPVPFVSIDHPTEPTSSHENPPCVSND